MAPSRTYTTSTDHEQCLSSVTRRRNPHDTTNGTNGTNGNPHSSSSPSSSSTSDLITSSSPNDPFTSSTTNTSNGTSTLGGILVTTTTTTTTRNANSPLTPIPRGPVITGPSPSPLSLGSPALQPMSPTRSRGSSSARDSDYARGSSRSRGTSRGRVMTNANIRDASATPRDGYDTHTGLPPVFGSGGDSEHYYNNYPLVNHLYGSGSTHHSRSSRGVPRGRGHGVFSYGGYAGFSGGSTNGVNGVHGSHGSPNSVNGVNGSNNSSGGRGRPRITANEGETAIRPPSYSIFTQRAMAAAAAAATPAGRGTGTSRGGPGPNNNVAPPVVSVGLPDSYWTNGNSAMTTGVDPSLSSSSRLSLSLGSGGDAGVVIGGGGGSAGGSDGGSGGGRGGAGAGAGQVTRTETERGPERGG